MSGRRPGERARGVLGLLGCLVLAVTLAAVVPDPATDVRRRWSTAEPGGWAETSTVRARVSEVVVTTSVIRDYGDPWTSGQRLVVVRVDAEVRRSTVRFSEVSLLTTDQRSYESRPEFATSSLAFTQPGFTRHATLVFEVPPDRVAGAALVIDRDGAAFDTYAEAIRIDLDLHDPVEVRPSTTSVPASTVTTT